jgi:hypothetical protein
MRAEAMMGALPTTSTPEPVMRTVIPSSRRPGAAVLAATLLAATLSAAVPAGPASASRPGADAASARDISVRVHRGGHAAKVVFHRARAGEVFLRFAAGARGVSWKDRGNTSAVVSAYVDGHYATDILIPSARLEARELALGHLGPGRHVLKLRYATGRSPSDAGVARLSFLSFRTVSKSDPGYSAARYAPILRGRNVPATGGKFQNNHTDAPLVAWHDVLPAATPGHSMIEYSVVWSNEDGGTSSAGLMAKWGRTTDIEWVYRIEVDAHGRRIGTGVFQSAGHGTSRFHGTFDGTHPLLQTCTTNNNVCDAMALKGQHQTRDPMRFALSTLNRHLAHQPRERLMDRHPWTYGVMAREMRREGKIESPSDPATPAVGDQRNYLYIAVEHHAVPAAETGLVGLAVDVRLEGDPTTYSSDHLQSPIFFTVNRDGPAATTVELPAGTSEHDVASISVRRVSVGATDPGASLTVTRIQRAFLLSRTYDPRRNTIGWRGHVVLTEAAPTAEVWPPAARSGGTVG